MLTSELTANKSYDRYDMYFWPPLFSLSSLCFQHFLFLFKGISLVDFSGVGAFLLSMSLNNWTQLLLRESKFQFFRAKKSNQILISSKVYRRPTDPRNSRGWTNPVAIIPIPKRKFINPGFGQRSAPGRCRRTGSVCDELLRGTQRFEKQCA